MQGITKVDVVMNVYGKPYQTAVSILSLLKHSGQWIDKIYFIEEKKQPHGANFDFIKEMLGDRLVYFKPKFWWYVRNQMEWRQLFRLPMFRHSIRYQYGWEKSDKDYILIMHNDVYVKGDIVGQYLEEIGGHIGIGKVGQCWNCSGLKAGVCSGEKYLSYRPTIAERDELFRNTPPMEERILVHQAFCKPEGPAWPLPECRLNEFMTLINLKMAKPLVWPKGPSTPFGLYNFELSVEWFRDMLSRGYYPKHLDFDPWVTHGWASELGSGHGALLKEELYWREEEVAQNVLKEEFGMEPAGL
ncbi:hypothetical protein CLV98_102275 [Dyadobacter jejuensis]|uniref:Glycosyl transferase family 2 n=1 Tax=Dyadobacter jejuensis TaxID=1082580 RepID=A0A316APD7_9BACT|nr:hypothetical protein [Dyadobacter jejuensis]PWJ59442.1 hypothetical protein CLV98_102275 [Dyadobacter jejuensis]